MGSDVGRVFRSSAGYVFHDNEVRVLVTSATPVNAVHEFCHIVSLHVNASFGNNPRWLWETVALYENGERLDPQSLAYLREGAFPTLVQLDADFDTNRMIYEVGYLLGEFIVRRWGQDALRRLIVANGALESVLGLDASAFEREWQAYVRRVYF